MAMNTLNRLMVVSALMVAFGCKAGIAGETVSSPRVTEYRHSVRRVADVAAESMDRAVVSSSPRHLANKATRTSKVAPDRVPRGIHPFSPRVMEMRGGIR